MRIHHPEQKTEPDNSQHGRSTAWPLSMMRPTTAEQCRSASSPTEPPTRLVAIHITPRDACSGACTGRTSCTTCTSQGVDREYGRCTACVRRAGRIASVVLQLSAQTRCHVHFGAVRQAWLNTCGSTEAIATMLATVLAQHVVRPAPTRKCGGVQLVRPLAAARGAAKGLPKAVSPRRKRPSHRT